MRTSFILILSFILMPSASFAWGQKSELTTAWKKASLTSIVLEKHAITYCINLRAQGFDPRFLGVQVEAALKLWLAAVHMEDIKFSEVKCNPVSEVDVEFDLGPDSEHPELAGYELSHFKDGHYYSLVTLNSDYRDHYPDKGVYSYVDFMSLVPAGYDLGQFLKYIGVQQMTTTSVGSMIGKNAYTAYDSTYRLFLHELGHAFGLCDLYRSQLHVNCDPEYMVPAINKRQPKAIMNDSSFFYLTRDDELGIESLFERFERPVERLNQP